LLRWWDTNTTNIAVPIDSAPRGLTFDGQYIWVQNLYGQRLRRVDPRTAQVVSNLALGFNAHHGIAFDGLHVWVATNEGAQKWSVATELKVQTLPYASIGQGETNSITFDGTHMWLCGGSGLGSLVKVRASDMTILQTVTIGNNPWGSCYDGANVWAANQSSNNVMKVRATDGALLGTFATAGNPRALCFDGASIWVTESSAHSVRKLRASDGLLEATTAVFTSPSGIVFDGTTIWVSHTSSNVVSRLRKSDGAVLGTYNVGPVSDFNYRSMAFDGANVWVATQAFAAANNQITKL
jgi:hypothetical protein